MKSNLHLFLIALILISYSAFSQQAHQHQAPPINSGSFSRGMFVDCMNEIIADVRNGSPLAQYDQLKTYIRDNYISFIELSDLDHNKVIGNPALEKVLRKILLDLKNTFPHLKIGVVGKEYDYQNATGRIKVSDYLNPNCQQNNGIYSAKQLDSLANIYSNNDELQRSETLKFFLRVMKISSNFKLNSNTITGSLIDVLYVDDPYWNDATTTPFSDIKTRFDLYCNTLQYLQIMKCMFPSIVIESEFQPTDLFWANGWTATDQIEQADKLIDRMMIPFYTDPYNSNSAFEVNCKLLHLLSDRFSKNGSRYYVGFSAQSNTYNFCNSQNTPEEHLGKYLSGQINPSGNMYSVETQFLSMLNDTTNFCTSCSCRTFDDNHFSPASLTSNICDGAIWFTYSMLNRNDLYKSTDEKIENKLITEIVNDELSIHFKDNSDFTFHIYNLEGKVVLEDNQIQSGHLINIEYLPRGFYFITANNEGRKFSRIIPVHYK